MPNKKTRKAINALGKLGRGGDTELAHINKQEAAVLRALGGSGTINPKTGLREYRGRGARDPRDFGGDRDDDRGGRDTSASGDKSSVGSGVEGKDVTGRDFEGERENQYRELERQIQNEARISLGNEMDPGFAEMGVTREQMLEAARQDVQGVSDILGSDDPEATRAYMRGNEEFQDYLDNLGGIDRYDVAEEFGLNVNRELFGGKVTSEITGVDPGAAATVLGMFSGPLGLLAKGANRMGLFGTQSKTAGSTSGPSALGQEATGPAVSDLGGRDGGSSYLSGTYGKAYPSIVQPQAAEQPVYDKRFVNEQGDYASGSFTPWWRQGYKYTGQ